MEIVPDSCPSEDEYFSDASDRVVEIPLDESLDIPLNESLQNISINTPPVSPHGSHQEEPLVMPEEEEIVNPLEVPEAVDEQEIEDDPDDISLASSTESVFEMVVEEPMEDILHPMIPLHNFPGDREYEDDKASGWKKMDTDDSEGIPPLPFMSRSYLTMPTHGRNPEDFFNAFFEDTMWELIADATNDYASQRIARLGVDALERMEHPDYRPSSRTNFWKAVTVNDIKIFFAHLIVMGIVRKPKLEHYWSTTGVAQTPFFGKWMSRNRFTAILSNIHLTDDSTNPRYGQPGHDPLAKLRPFMDMCERNFCHVYRPQRNLSMDESCCPWKGRLRFKVYNPRKPARFHIKLYQMCEASSGYIVGFNVYTGKNSCIDETVVFMDPESSKTSKIVLSLADKCDVLDKGHIIYCDNYYSSPELMEGLLFRDTLSCGTVRKNRKGFPAAVKNAKLQRGQCCFRRKYDDDNTPAPLLALKWQDKRDVYMLSTLHLAEDKWTGKNDRTTPPNPIYKPSCIVDYIQNMGGVDLSDQLMTYYTFLRRSCKWWRKLFIHMLNMLILNAFILHKKYGRESLSHSEYRERIARYLMETALIASTEDIAGPTINLNLINPAIGRFVGRHFPVKLPARGGRIVPLLCKVCSVNKRTSQSEGKPQRRRSSSYKCQQCNMVMCVDPCFREFHSN